MRPGKLTPEVICGSENPGVTLRESKANSSTEFSTLPAAERNLAYATRFPSQVQTGKLRFSPSSAAKIRWGASPFAPISQISLPPTNENAICEPSGETAAPLPPSRSFLAWAPKIESTQMLSTFDFESARVATIRVPSGNQLRFPTIESWGTKSE